MASFSLDLKALLELLESVCSADLEVPVRIAAGPLKQARSAKGLGVEQRFGEKVRGGKVARQRMDTDCGRGGAWLGTGAHGTGGEPVGTGGPVVVGDFMLSCPWKPVSGGRPVISVCTMVGGSGGNGMVPGRRGGLASPPWVGGVPVLIYNRCPIVFLYDPRPPDRRFPRIP